MDLYPTFAFGDVDLTSYPFSVEFGADRGSAEATIAAVASALRDGSFSRITRYENRTITIPILIEGPSLGELAENEATLVAEVLKQRNQFAFHPGDDFSFASVYDTLAAQLEPSYDDELEQQLMRRFTLTFEASPRPRSVDKVITPAVTGSTPTVIDNGSSTSGWAIAYYPSASLSVASGAVTSTYDPAISDGAFGTGMNRSFGSPVDTSTSKFVGVDWKSSVASVHAFREVGGANLTEVRREPLAGGFKRSWYQLPDSVTELHGFHFGIVHAASSAPSATLSVDQVLLANALPNSGTARQKIATVVPGGSVPSEGVVVVEHPTSGLGQTIVYSHPLGTGYTPPLRQWLVSSDDVTTDAAMVSGATNRITAATVYRVPVSALPEGDAHFWARMYSDTAGTFRVFWAAGGHMAGVNLGGQDGSTLVNFPAPGAWVLVPLARLTLPDPPLGPEGYTFVSLQKEAAASAILYVDEGWLFAMERGTLSVLNCGAGTPAVGSSANRLRIEAPSLEKINGGMTLATASDWSDAHPAAEVMCDQVNHKFDPDGSMIFTATAGATDASVSLEHYPRWHSNAGS